MPQTQYSRLLLPLSVISGSHLSSSTGHQDWISHTWPGDSVVTRLGLALSEGTHLPVWGPWPGTWFVYFMKTNEITSLISWRIVLLISYLLAIYILFLYIIYLLNSNPFQAWWCQCCYVNIMRFWWASWQLSAPKYKNIYLREWGI